MAAKLASGGKGRYEIRQNADINVTPFVDVMLVLLIIFMVAAPLATTFIKIDLPPAHDSASDKKPTFLSIHRGGTVDIVAQANVIRAPDLAHLTGMLAPLLTGEGPSQDRTVLIRADRDVRYSEFMAVTNRLQSDGYYHIGLIAEELG